ncbi:MAG: class I SAM-dependent methyltransferase, partial [Coprobacillaceae bacterium]
MKKTHNKGIISYLIKQCKSPNGVIGASMITIWNRVFKNMTVWGLSHLDIHPHDHILDIGCGGGSTINSIIKQIETGKVYGIDISKLSVKKSKMKNEA